MKTIIIYTSLFFFAFSQIKAAETYSLKQCIELGLEKNYEIRIVRNNQQISDNNMTIGNAGYLPQIDLSAGYSGTINDIEQKQTSGDKIKNNGVHDQALNAGVNLSWTIFDGFNIQANYSKLKELKQMGELDTRLTIENFISNLTAEYYNYIQQRIRLKNLKYAVHLSNERLRIVEARYHVGASSRLDLQQAKVDFNADSSKLIKQYEVIFASRVKMNQMMALDDVEQGLFVTDSLIAFNSMLEKNSLWQSALLSNPMLLISQKEKNISRFDLKMAQSPNYPYLKINGGYGYTLNKYDNSNINRQDKWGFNYGITLGFNIFDGFNNRRKQKNAKIELQNRELEYQQLELGVKSDFSNIWMAYQNNMELTNLEKENLNTARDNYEIAIERYKLGDLSGIELREAQNSLLEAEERLVQAQYNTKLCEISLKQISGQISSFLEE